MFEHVGKEVVFDFGTSGQIQVKYLSDSRLKWTALHERQDGGPQSCEEDFYYKKTQDGAFLISWVEESGIVVSQVANFKEQKVSSCLTWPAAGERGNRGIKLTTGTIRFLS